MEEWRDIPEYEKFYQVSNAGRVKSLRNNIVLKPGKFPNGYLYADAYGFKFERKKNKKILKTS
jgi:hypothetical protein